MMHKQGRFTRLLACLLAFILIMNMPVVSLAENEVADTQESPTASEPFEPETENPPEVTEPAPEADPAAENPPEATEPTPEADPAEENLPEATEPSPGTDPAEENPPEATEPTPEADPAEENPPEATEPTPEADPAEEDPTEATEPGSEADPAEEDPTEATEPTSDLPDEPEDPDLASDDELENADAESDDEEEVDAETVELQAEQFEALLLELNSTLPVSDTVPSTMYVEPSSANHLTERVYLDISRATKTASSNSNFTYNITCSLSLPADAVVSQCMFSWDSSLKANGSSSSGGIAVPSLGQTTEYTFTKSGNGQTFKVVFSVTTYDLPTAMWVDSTKNNGLAGQVYAEITNKADSTVDGTSLRTYTCEMVLPFGAVPEQCFLTWNGEQNATVDDTEYASGACPAPAPGETKTYTFSNGGSRSVAFVITAFTALPDTMWVELSDSERVYLVNNGSSYSLKLPFGVPDGCVFCWNGGLKATVDGQEYASGECPVPAKNSQKTYSFSNGKNTVSFSVTTSVIEPRLRVEPSAENGIPARIDVFVSNTTTSSQGYGNNKKTTYTYTCGLYLPGSAALGNCVLFWDGSIEAAVNGQGYGSGQCLVPAAGTTTAYTFTSGNTTWVYNITTYQGSSAVASVFIEIDESLVTIVEMDSDPNHDTECSGIVYINGSQYELTKMKGRGNATWDKSQDKRPYNITLGKKINFPGINSEKTKKWSFLAENFDRSLLGNRAGYKLAEELGIGQDTASADVWMNGEYQGCYTVTPKTDSFVTDDGFMIEQDNYLDDPVAAGGDPQFKLDGMNESSGWSSCYNRITIKDIGDNLLMKDGVVDECVENIEAVAKDIQSWLQDAWDAVRSDSGYNSQGKHYTEYIDIESCAKMYLMFEYVKSYDVCAGSILFHRDGQTDADKLIAGPIWDLDNAMGSTYRNSSLGKADDRSNGDRRSGEGDFIPLVTEYKTSFYKTLSKHTDFMEEVVWQYNKNKAAFDSLPGIVEQMSQSIEDSAGMNFNKVVELGHTGNPPGDNHYYGSETTLGSGEYQQTYEATNSWANYVENLKTFVTTRSQWFQNKFTDPNFVDPATCEHQYVEDITLQPTCTSTGSATYTCPICRDSYTETLPKIAHNYQNNVCTVCGEALLHVTIACDNGASVTVYETQNLTDGPCVENAESAHPRDSETGLIDCSGNGQVNFVVVLEDGRQLDSVTATKGAYKNLKGPGDTGVSNGYRLTKVSRDLTITVTVYKFVTFDANGHGEAPEKQNVQSGSLAQTPEEPIAAGYAFGGWYTNAACTGEAFDFSTPVSEDITLYAKWTQVFSVPTFTKQSLVLSGQIGVNFFLALPEINGVDYADSYMEFTVNGKTATAAYNPNFKNTTGEYYGFTCYVNSIQMAETITAVFHYGDGQTVDKTYSVKQYLEAFDTASGGFDATTVALFEALGDYGHYVQPFLSDAKGWSIGTDYAEMDKYYTNSYSISNVVSAVADYAISRENSDPDIEKITYTLALDSGTDIMVYFKPAAGYSGSFAVTVGGNAWDAVKQADGRYLVKIPGISAHLLGTIYTIVATTETGNATVTVSALSYVQGLLSAYTDSRYQNAAASIWYYYAAAQAYKTNH